MSTLTSKLAIAPMIDWTFSHFRVFMRMIAPFATLYTDMQTTGAILNNHERALNFNRQERPLGLQVGGAEKEALVSCAKLAEQAGFDEINLNLGCPSARVQAGRFGACLMKEPDHVAECIQAMKENVTIPVSAKTRIGLDEQDSYAYFAHFAHRLVAAGCDKLIVHARKAWLHGLNPKQNRTIPPLHYDYVYAIKKDLPHIPVILNGNTHVLEEIHIHLQHVDGVMIGRLAYQNPYAIAVIHHGLYPEVPLPNRASLLWQFLEYVEEAFEQGVPLTLLLKPLWNMAHGLAGAKQWKKHLMRVVQMKQLDLLHEAVYCLTQLEQNTCDSGSNF